MTGAELIAAAKSASALARFISGGGLQAAIAAVIGDIHADAAKLALSMSSISNTPSDRVKSAITHLEAAQAAYGKILAVDSEVGTAWHLCEIRRVEAKSRWVCSLMAVCYAHLGDAPAATRAIEMARQSFALDDKIERGGLALTLMRLPLWLPIGLLNPATWTDMFRTADVPDMSRSDIDSLAKSLQDVVAASSWKAGNRHPTQPNVVARAAPNVWHAAPGYSWVNESQDDLRVKWSPGTPHPDHPNVVAGSEEGQMIPAPGFKWLNDSPGDFQVVPQ